MKFKYLLIKSTFPSIYFSQEINITSTPRSIASTYTNPYSIRIMTSPDPRPLFLGNNTVFLYAFTDCWLNLTKTIKDSSFGLNFTFTVIDSENFTLRVATKYTI